MVTFKPLVRNTVKALTQLPVPGKYVLVEQMKPFIVQNQPVITRTKHDLLFELNLNDLIQRQIFFDLYDYEEVSFLSQLVNEGDIVFDLGGNVGFYTVVLAKKVGPAGKVHVFEPVPDNLKQIHSNLTLNNMGSYVIVNSVAVSDYEGTLELHLPDNPGNSGWASIVPSKSRPNIVKIPAINLDSYIEQHGIKQVRLIKMDIEGAELAALKGMRSLLERPEAPIIYFEMNPFLLGQLNINPVEIKQFLADLGYQLFVLHKNDLKPVLINDIETQVCNLLAMKKPGS